ncbi:MAG: transmembrane anchor protein, partial [Gemmatimonadota bacterium]|nr:transmembrane anchor protein [Gemmatimonadota bacterium]
MYNTNIPIDRELPSSKKLLKSTILAAATAAVLLVTVVMPAEYGIDPTGLGKIIG